MAAARAATLNAAAREGRPDQQAGAGDRRRDRRHERRPEPGATRASRWCWSKRRRELGGLAQRPARTPSKARTSRRYLQELDRPGAGHAKIQVLTRRPDRRLRRVQGQLHHRGRWSARA
ncbi:MAG: hypothetical protein MZV70_44730 [Desulfobacterales bacterium]|nr:hypothetical protein [Desulfobacterales bacterium]